MEGEGREWGDKHLFNHVLEMASTQLLLLIPTVGIHGSLEPPFSSFSPFSPISLMTVYLRVGRVVYRGHHTASDAPREDQ